VRFAIAGLLLFASAVAASVGCIGTGANECGGGIVCPADKACVTGGGCASPEQIAACDGFTDGTACSFAREVGNCINGVCIGSLCGNSGLDPGEVCDWGSDSRCRKDCLKIAACGDGMLDAFAGEQCDDGAANSDAPDATCRTNCRAKTCGDGVIDPTSGEVCEEGQLGTKTCRDFGYYLADGLGCNAACGYDVTACTGGRCGDGIVNGGEDCDGAPPAANACTEVGFAAGALGCLSLCVPDTAACQSIGWRRLGTQSLTPRAMWASSDDDVFVASPNGTVWNWDGLVWTAMTTGLPNEVYGVWGFGPANIVAVGNGGDVARWTGTTWSLAASGITTDLYAVAGVASDDLWVVGGAYYAGQAAHWNGTTWQVYTPGTAGLHSVSAAASDDVWMGSENGEIVHWDGSALTVLRTGIGSVNGLFAAGHNDVWAIVEPSNLLHWDGIGWTGIEIDTYPDELRSLAGSGPDDIWAVGHQTLHYHNKIWSRLEPAETGPIQAIAVPSAGHAVLAGAAVWRYQGNGWGRSLTPGAFYAIGATGPTERFAVGDLGLVYRWDGTNWHRIQFAGLVSAVWGRYFVGKAGAIGRWDGAAIVPMSSGTTSHLHGVWGTSDSDVYAVGDAGTTLHYDGSAWTPMTLPVTPRPPLTLLAVGGTSATDVYAVGYDADSLGEILHWDGIGWTDIHPGTYGLLAVWARDPDDVFVTDGASVVHWDGAAWTDLNAGNTGAVRSITGDNSAVYIADGTNQVRRWNGTAWSVITLPVVTYAIWQTQPGQLLAAGERLSIYDYDGTAHWEAGADAPASSEVIWVDAPDDVWSRTAFTYTLNHFDGLVWAKDPHVGAVWGTGRDDVFIVGTSTMDHWDGTSWTTTTHDQGVIRLAGLGHNDVWSNAGNVIEHWNGSTWSHVPAGGSGFRTIWAAAANDAWLTSTGGLQHWDGTAWTPVASPTSNPSFIWGSGANDVYVVGVNGVAHWNGTAWTVQPTGTSLGFDSLAGAGPGDMFATLSDGEVLHGDGNSWTPVRTLNDQPAYGSFVAGTAVYLTANSFLVLLRDRTW
jgi:hypothetical protein